MSIRLIFEKLIVSYLKKKSLEDKLNFIDNFLPLEFLFNDKYREVSLKNFLKLKESDHKKINGPDSDLYSLKSSKIEPNSDNKYRITKSKSLGEIGRINMDTPHDEKDTLCGLFTPKGKLIFVIKIIYDENFNNFFVSERIKKQKFFETSSRGRDSAKLSFAVIEEFSLNYEILKMDDCVEFGFDLNV